MPIKMLNKDAVRKFIRSKKEGNILSSDGNLRSSMKAMTTTTIANIIPSNTCQSAKLYGSIGKTALGSTNHFTCADAKNGNRKIRERKIINLVFILYIIINLIRINKKSVAFSQRSYN